MGAGSASRRRGWSGRPSAGVGGRGRSGNDVGCLVLYRAASRAGGEDAWHGQRAQRELDEALALAHRVDNRCDLAFPHLLRGELFLKRDPTNAASAEEAFRTALDIAKEQGARSWGLRAAFALAKLYQSTARPVDAYAVLAPALEGFTPTSEMPEIAQAQALLAAIEAGAHVRPE